MGDTAGVCAVVTAWATSAAMRDHGLHLPYATPRPPYLVSGTLALLTNAPSTGRMARTGRRHPAQIEVGRRARARREELGLSQMALAERIGLHFTFVSEVERGERNLSLSSLLRLAEGLDMNPATLVDGVRWSSDSRQ